MGSGCSTNEPGYDDTYALGLYQTALGTCVLPDVGIDESLLKYSGVSSNTELQTYSNELLNSVPGYVEKLGSALGGLTSVPNAVGIAAMVISMVMELIIKSSTQTQSVSTYSMLQRVFGEEKASSVRDMMVEYLKRHRMYITDDQRLLVEIRRLEALLSIHLTSLKDSLLYDNQMSSRGFKIWVNGAAFHVQMLIHEARLRVQAREHASHYVEPIEAAIDVYLQDLDALLEKYKTYKISKTELKADKETFCSISHAPYIKGEPICGIRELNCIVKNTEIANCDMSHQHDSERICDGCDMTKAFINHVFSKYKPISNLRTYFSDLKNNINSLINQHEAFTVPSGTYKIHFTV